MFRNKIGYRGNYKVSKILFITNYLKFFQELSICHYGGLKSPIFAKGWFHYPGFIISFRNHILIYLYTYLKPIYDIFTKI